MNWITLAAEELATLRADPLLWEHIQSVPGWDQGSGPATWLKSFLVDQMLHDASSPFTWSKAAQGVLAIGMLALVPRIARRLGWAYALLTAGVILLPVIGTKDFMGTGRYLLAAFPVFAVAGEWLADRPRLRVVVVGAGAVEVVAAAVVVGTNSRVRALSGAARKEAAPRSPPRAMTVGIAQRFLESAGFTSAGKYARR